MQCPTGSAPAPGRAWRLRLGFVLLAAAGVLAGCTSAGGAGGYAQARTVIIERAWGVPVPDARIVKVNLREEPMSRLVVEVGPAGRVILPPLRPDTDNGVPEERYIVSAPGFKPFVIWPEMLAGTSLKGPGYALLNGSLVITPSPAIPAAPSPPPPAELMLPGAPPPAENPAPIAVVGLPNHRA